MELSNKKIAVIGLGKTGKGACRFLAAKGARIFATDEKSPSLLGDVKAELTASGEEIELVPYDVQILDGADLVIPSPGVPPANMIIREAIRRGIPVRSELEIAARFLKRPMIAITGTNGKTTTTTLTGHILSACGKRVFVGGNIGNPLINYVGGAQDDDYAVIEVSSFQLQWIETLRPFVAVLLNVTCDHVDYHGSFAAYREAKENIFRNQTADDFAILNAEDEGTGRLAGKLAAKVIRFSSSEGLKGTNIFIENEQIVYCPDKGPRETYPIDMIKIPGRHNVENVMAALAIGRICGCAPADIIKAIAAFKGLPHRIEFSGEKKGVSYYDDSKGTNVDAVQRALETFHTPVVLLLGGRDKAGDFESLIPEIKAKVKSLILFGEARFRIESLVGGVVKTTSVPTLKDAIHAAHEQAIAG
ncbi:MAG: UDP-N-acetylmuramoyl-L-alanine--D-glutamate ligase, partial [Syntrophales bacterium]|nr:UDP-N-acetylmuramoyl-L-alanine--D-glutamate ligase [Syntrophales bacterium]